jgi:hypothetical protein
MKLTKPSLCYDATHASFRCRSEEQTVGMPELGFLFPAYENGGANLYSVVYTTKNLTESREALTNALFGVPMPMPANLQKEALGGVLSASLKEECSYDVVQTVHDQLCQRIELHKESKVPEALMISKTDVKEVLSSCGVSEEHLAKFSVDYDETFGFEADLHPKNIIDHKRFEIKTPDVSIKVAPDRTDLIETRIIGGVKYLLINAEENVEVNGVSIHIADAEPATV